MEIVLASISPRRSGITGTAGELMGSYLQRAGRYCSCSVTVYASEAKLLGAVEAAGGRTRPVFLAADPRGEMVTSEELAAEVGRRMDGGVQLLVVGIGPADGWSAAALARADRRISFGRITLPHELAAVVASEQIYRALTIRAGHPYHSGH
jgi:23S rRNA (pseudouridine1915-N3)-methyltransferase